MTPIWGTFGGASARGFGRGIVAGPTSISVDYLVVGGGGGAGYYAGGGGGGGGGYRAATGYTASLNLPYTVTVGAGGNGTSGLFDNQGNNSVFASITAYGGGGAGLTTGANGGCGGGGAGDTDNNPGGVGSQGGNGGTGHFDGRGSPYSSDTRAGGGGGGGGPNTGGTGALGPGYNPGSGNYDDIVAYSGGGGAGILNTIDGNSYFYAGGGGAGVYCGDSVYYVYLKGGDGGSGGGGGGSAYAPSTPRNGGNGGSGGRNDGGSPGELSTTGGNGGANTGGGGGGARGLGGSGIVIIKIPNTYTATFSAGVTRTLSTAVAGYKIYTVTATSTTSETVTFS